jgi:hypothetical protein
MRGRAFAPFDHCEPSYTSSRAPMRHLSELRERFEPALRGLLNNWRVWSGNDQIRALHIGFDSTNTEIAVSLLTDREPYLDEQNLSPFGERWPVADWRLYGLNASYRHRFPGAEDVLEWMRLQSEQLSEPALTAFNTDLKGALFEIATGERVRQELARFRRVASPFKMRVEWFFDDKPLDAEFPVPI